MARKMKMYKGNHVKFVLVYFVLFILELRIWAGPEDPSVCPLNLTAYPYLPAGECSENVQEELDDWDSFPTTRCCLNGLTAFTQSLAIHALANDSIFLTKNQWGKCDGSFSRQQSVSIKNCSFDALYYDQSPCQNLSLSTLKSTYPKQDQFVLGNCSSFNSSYDSTCQGCTRAIQEARDVLLKQVKENEQNKTLKGICGVAVVIAAVSQHINDPQWVGDFYRCLPGSAREDAGFVKIKSSVAKALLVVMVAIMLLLLVVVFIKYVAKKKSIKPVEGKEISAWSGLYKFSRSEIESAINFKSRKVSLGAGSAGRVYKGILPSGQVVGIKHIYKGNTSDSFTREVEGLSRIRHPNLVCLFGCCVDNGEQYLVYEYCSNGNLAQHLLKRDSSLTWAKRVKILRDCANALRFLHGYPDGCIVHRDIKLTNILLTENMEPKLSDFGLAKMLGMEESKVFTDVRGTIGYMDPEYMSNAKLTCASDIYSFGIVMLQLLSGRKVIELDLDARDQLTRKAKDVIMGKRPITDFEDPRLKGELNAEDFESILHVAVLCVAKSSKGRPTIDVVLQELDKVWQNTKSYKKSKGGKSSSDTPSRSLEVMEV